MKNLYQTSARTRWDGSGGIFRKYAVFLLLSVMLLPVSMSAAGSEPVRGMSQAEVPPPHRAALSAERSATARATRFPGLP